MRSDEVTYKIRCNEMRYNNNNDDDDDDDDDHDDDDDDHDDDDHDDDAITIDTTAKETRTSF